MLDDADLNAYVDAFGVSCAKGATAFKGILDMPDMVTMVGELLTTEYALTYVTTAVTLDDGDSITVAGTTCEVRGPARKIDDGKFSRVYLEKS